MKILKVSTIKKIVPIFIFCLLLVNSALITYGFISLNKIKKDISTLFSETNELTNRDVDYLGEEDIEKAIEDYYYSKEEERITEGLIFEEFIECPGVPLCDDEYTYVNPQYHYSFKFHPTWTLKRYSDQKFFDNTLELVNGPYSIIITINNSSMGDDIFIEPWEKYNYPETSAVIDGVSVRKINIPSNVASNNPMYVYSRLDYDSIGFVVNGNEVFIRFILNDVNIDASSDECQKAISEMDGIIASFRWGSVLKP